MQSEPASDVAVHAVGVSKVDRFSSGEKMTAGERKRKINILRTSSYVIATFSPRGFRGLPRLFEGVPGVVLEPPAGLLRFTAAGPIMAWFVGRVPGVEPETVIGSETDGPSPWNRNLCGGSGTG